MATPEQVQPSRRLQQAAAAERARLKRELDQSVRQTRTLREKLAAVEQRRLEIEQRLTLLDQLAGSGEPLTARPADDNVIAFPELAGEPAHGYLRGSMIRLIAVRLLAATSEPTQPIHYTDWYRLVCEAGYGISGRDPLASFLTQISRSPVVIRGDGPGAYLLDLSAPGELRARLDELNAELLSLHEGQQTIEAITSARERRAELITEIGRAERALEEAIEALGLPTTPTH